VAGASAWSVFKKPCFAGTRKFYKSRGILLHSLKVATVVGWVPPNPQRGIKGMGMVTFFAPNLCLCFSLINKN